MDGSTNIDNTSATLESSYCGGPCSILESLSLSVCLTNWENNNGAQYAFVKLHKPLKRILDTLFEFKVMCFIFVNTREIEKKSPSFFTFYPSLYFSIPLVRMAHIHHRGYKTAKKICRSLLVIAIVMSFKLVAT